LKTRGEKAKRERKREYGMGERLSYIRGLKEAAQKVAREEQLMLNFDPKGKQVN
jgi:hypothetical protein